MPEDSVVLAEFLGWREATSVSHLDFLAPGSTTYMLTTHVLHGDVVVTFNGGINAGRWEPFLRPDHAALVAAEAVKRGWALHLKAEAGACHAWCHRPDNGMFSAPSEAVVDYGFAGADRPYIEAWASAISRAVLAAIKGGAS
jgi:hypothetical protein